MDSSFEQDPSVEACDPVRLVHDLFDEAMQVVEALATMSPEELERTQRALDLHLDGATVDAAESSVFSGQSIESEEPRAIVARFFSPC